MLPDLFLGGSTPRLLRPDFWGIPFPGFGKLPLSIFTIRMFLIPDTFLAIVPSRLRVFGGYPIPNRCLYTRQFHRDLLQPTDIRHFFIAPLLQPHTQKHSRHPIEQTWIFPMNLLTLHFGGEQGQLIGRCLSWGSLAEHRTGGFHTFPGL